MYQSHIVASGDTIQKIGDIYGVNWTDIITINRLVYPYVDASDFSDYEDVDTVATVGQAILIPTNDMQTGVIRNANRRDLENLTFGRDLDIFSYTTGNVVPLETIGELINDENNDLKTSDGLKNLSQALIIRLGTPVGALPLHPDFGSNIMRYIGKKGDKDALIKVKLEVQEAILSDERVAGVGNVSVTAENGVVDIHADVQPIDPYGIFTLRARLPM